jgi:hypothetical protein
MGQIILLVKFVALTKDTEYTARKRSRGKTGQVLDGVVELFG